MSNIGMNLLSCSSGGTARQELAQSLSSVCGIIPRSPFGKIYDAAEIYLGIAICSVCSTKLLQLLRSKHGKAVRHFRAKSVHRSLFREESELLEEPAIDLPQ